MIAAGKRTDCSYGLITVIYLVHDYIYWMVSELTVHTGAYYSYLPRS